MTNLKKEIIENGIHYTLHGDYYFPDLDLPEGSRQSIGHYGRMRKAYLEEHRPGLYTRLILSGKLYEHYPSGRIPPGCRGVRTMPSACEGNPLRSK